ncbi:MAG: vanadium-dependent haloperoxidase [Candidatus Kapabacteria bacterium]|nr:vanadium-dependent haloperoxidase [Candidatus Kapabacteria bacterium]
MRACNAPYNSKFITGSPIRYAMVMLVSAFTFLSISCGDGAIEPDPLPTVYDASGFDGDELVTGWYSVMYSCVGQTPGYTEPVAARAYAYLGITLYESVVNGMPNNRSLAGQLNGLHSMPVPDTAGKRFHWSLAANAAMAEYLRLTFAGAPAQVVKTIDSLEQKNYSERTALTKEPDMSERSVAYGKQVGAAIFEYAKTDGGHGADLNNFPAQYTPAGGDADWIPTPPDNRKVPMLPDWGKNRPLALPEANVLDGRDPGAFPAFSVDKSSAFYSAANSVYNSVKTLKPEQRSLAQYWSGDATITSTVTAHIFSMMNQYVQTGAYRLDAVAELYAKVGIAMNDGCVSCFAAKYKYPLMRPLSYIQKNIDRTWNANKVTDPVVTPSMPEYVSGHTVQAAAAVELIKEVFPRTFLIDRTLRRTRSMPEREYATPDAILNEIVLAQKYSGTHYGFSIDAGTAMGKNVAATLKARLQFRKERPFL